MKNLLITILMFCALGLSYGASLVAKRDKSSNMGLIFLCFACCGLLSYYFLG